ncbi:MULTISPECIES: hypothetical protein [Frankia]|uniref:Uncharacterized protein n=1 Tax=Frankia alni (strain DSM 45986 / CECT 9034 / ACN14a) TaxID=326424 RepID=Q0RM48_FRAAA|nr:MULTISPECIES: hypothetical protein [Frankia]CAJ61404.1 hypothetical protein FRAAL2760 [Frankia alni ACN14a]
MKTFEAWLQQAKAAQGRLQAANGGKDMPLREYRAADPVAFAQLIQALDALTPYTGKPVAEDLRELAGLKDVNQII